jgi:hypothetical protein
MLIGNFVIPLKLLAQRANGARRVVYAWCLFGVADLVVAITMGTLTSPEQAHLLAFENLPSHPTRWSAMGMPSSGGSPLAKAGLGCCRSKNGVR